MFTNFFIRRPIFASVCSLLIILIGVVSYTRLPVREYPDIEPPIITVSTIYPGANPRIVETEVTEILEDEINSVDGIKTLQSTSSQGSSQITVEFELNRDLDVAAQDVRSRVNRVTGELPDTVDSPVIQKEGSGGGAAIIWFALYGENFTTLELSDYADATLTDQLESVTGVSRVQIGGERRYAMRLWLDPQTLAARALTVLEVEQALRSQNVSIPSGVIEGQLNEFSVRTLGRLESPAEYEELVLRSDDQGAQVLLRDVGYAEIGAESYRTFVRFRGQSAVGLGINKLSDANTLSVASAVKAEMEELSQDFPAGMQYAIASDDSRFVQVAINRVWQSLLFAVALVVLVIFIFLRDWRATLIPAVTIPVALIGAFGVMYLLGFSINTLTLFALTLATGLVVDDTIVVLENIDRHVEDEGMPPYNAAKLGVAEVVFAVIATTLVLVAVFLPVGFSTGTTGRLFTEFALTLAGAVVLSSFVALTLAPALSARLLRQHGKMDNWLFNWVEKFLDRLREGYLWSLRQAIKLRWLVVALFVAAVVVTYGAYQLLPQAFLPTEDRASIFTIVRAPEGVSLNYTDQVMQQIEQIYSEVPEIESYFVIGGFGGGGGGNVNRGITFVDLKPWGDRDRSQQAVVNELRQRVSQIPEAIVIPTNPSGLPGAGFSQPIQFVVQEPDLQALAQYSNQLVGQARQIPSVVNADSDFQLNKPEITVEVDRFAAADLGVSVADISNTLQILVGGQDITNFNQENRRYEVVVRAQEEYRNTIDSISNFYVRSQAGDLVSLSNVVNVDRSTTPPQINHFNRLRSATISGSPAPGSSLGDALTALQNTASEILPASISTALAGESLQFQEAGQSILLIFGLALVFIFLVLAAQFESYFDPIVILVAVPLALLGAFLALLIAGLQLNVFGQVGLIMLIGLVTKNSILIVEFANQERDQGKSINEAAISAGNIRFRPILMTAFSTIFGLMPLALSSGAGAASRTSLGTVVLGGMVVSTVLSLYAVPVFYAILTRAQRGVVSWFKSSGSSDSKKSRSSRSPS
jgi:hydrophobe/amphiphile efflux-1 (HAE1) family protein